MNITIEQIVNDFKETTLWSNNIDGLTIWDFDQQTNKFIEQSIKSFINLLNIDQFNALTNNDEWDQFGHWLALEMQGYGAGFFDSTDDNVSSISETLDNEFKDRFEVPYIDDGLVRIDFYTIK